VYIVKRLRYKVYFAEGETTGILLLSDSEYCGSFDSIKMATTFIKNVYRAETPFPPVYYTNNIFEWYTPSKEDKNGYICTYGIERWPA